MKTDDEKFATNRTLGPTACSEMSNVFEKMQVEEKFMIVPRQPLTPAANRFTLECLQESTRRSECFLHADFMHIATCIHRNPVE